MSTAYTSFHYYIENVSKVLRNAFLRLYAQDIYFFLFEKPN